MSISKTQDSRGVSELSLMRRGLGFYLLFYYLPFFPQLKEFFFDQQMIDRFLISPPLPSLLFLFPSLAALYFFYFLLLIFSFFLLQDKITKLELFFLYLLNLSFHHANPLLIHEPQQITSYLLIVFLFFPTEKNKKVDFFLLQMVISFLAFYYFVAGFKKLFDPLWVSGSALEKLLKWEGLGRFEFSVSAQASYLSTLIFNFLNYFVLCLELSVPFWIFTRRRSIGLFFLILMHLGIKVFMDVGSFSEIMIVWQFCAWDKKTCLDFLSLFLKLVPRRGLEPPHHMDTGF